MIEMTRPLTRAWHFLLASCNKNMPPRGSGLCNHFPSPTVHAEVCSGSGQVREATCSWGTTARAPDHPASRLARSASRSRALWQPRGLSPDSGPPPPGVALVCKQPWEVWMLLMNQTLTALGS